MDYFGYQNIRGIESVFSDIGEDIFTAGIFIYPGGSAFSIIPRVHTELVYPEPSRRAEVYFKRELALPVGRFTCAGRGSIIFCMVKIKDLPRVDRPREKLLKYGPAKLTTTELLAILLRTGIKGLNVIELSNKILKHFGVENVQNISVSDLLKIKGLGPVKAAEIIACLELGKRLLKDKQPLAAISPHAVFDSLKDIRELKKEHFIAIYLDTSNQEISREVVSIGTLNASLVHPREVFEPAVKNLAASIILVHNHPSGDLKPSHEDLLITKKLVDSGRLLDIHVLDHIIITKTGYTSLKEQKLI